MRRNHLAELHNDAGTDVGHDAQHKNAELGQRTTTEHVVQAEQRALVLTEEFSERNAINTGRRDKNAQPVDGEHRKGEQDAVPEIRNAQNVRNGLNHAPYPCGVCQRAVAETHRAICCNICQKWVHIKCNNLDKNDYNFFQENS